MNKLYLSFSLSLFSAACFAQNLVPNPSFEDTIACPNLPGQITWSEGWTNPTLGSPDYYNSCSMSEWSRVPNNNYGTQNPYDGNAYAGIYTYTSINGDYREYIQIELTDTLKQGRRYSVKFHVNLSDSSIYSCDDIGIHLSHQQVSSPLLQENLLIIPQIHNDTSNSLAGKTDWMEVNGVYFATGGEKFITLGNFKDDSESDGYNVGGSTNLIYAYYYIDDIYIGLNDTLSINEYEDHLVSVFPNPSNENINIDFSSESANHLLFIYDLFGKIILESNKLYATNQINIQNLSDGIYFLVIKSNYKQVFSQKIIINHQNQIK